MRPIVTEDMLQSAFDYLNEQAEAAAQAKADLILAEFHRKKVRGELVLANLHSLGTVGLREYAADSHPDYMDACRREAEAAKAVAWHIHQRARVDAITSAWQTQESSRRALARVA